MAVETEEFEPGFDTSPTGLTSVAEGVKTVVSGLPASVRKNASRAFGQLCTAAMQVPTAWFETKANEMRAASEARIELTHLTSQQIGGQLRVDPAYGEAASEKFAQSIVRKQKNLDEIGRIAAEQLRIEPTLEEQEEQEEREDDISEDWLNAFESEASEKSSDEMQRVFGKILAGEISKPKSFSIKTLKLISELDNRAAVKFRELCSIAVSLEHAGKVFDVRVVSLGDAGTNTLGPYGLPYKDLNLLAEYGLIISDYNSWSEYGAATVRDDEVALPFMYGDQPYAFKPHTPATGSPSHHVTGVAFTNSGKELFRIVEKIPNPSYFEAFKEFFKSQRYDVKRVKW